MGSTFWARPNEAIVPVLPVLTAFSAVSTLADVGVIRPTEPRAPAIGKTGLDCDKALTDTDNSFGLFADDGLNPMRRSVKQMFSACGQAMDALFWLACAVALTVLLGGCSDAALEFTEVKRIHEKATEAELETFLRVVAALPDKKLPEFASPFAPPPEWDHERTLPVSELVDEEIKSLAARTDVARLARPLHKNRRLLRALRREQMTPEQFVGLSLAIGVALSRSRLRDDQNLDETVAQGEAAIEGLKRNTEPFHLHSLEGKYRVLREAVWITRVDRARMLRKVPPENYQQLVSQHRDELLAVFPEWSTKNPLDDVADLLRERGVPFEELPGMGNDAEITWDAKDAHIGHDRPDDELRIDEARAR